MARKLLACESPHGLCVRLGGQRLEIDACELEDLIHTTIPQLFGMQQVGRSMNVGMVQVAQTTYRIVRVGEARYDAVRILDDRLVGTFVTEPRLEVIRSEIGIAAMVEIASAAVRMGRVSWSQRASAAVSQAPLAETRS